MTTEAFFATTRGVTLDFSEKAIRSIRVSTLGKIAAAETSKNLHVC